MKYKPVNLEVLAVLASVDCWVEDDDQSILDVVLRETADEVLDKLPNFRRFGLTSEMNGI
jgi:hypothetical protein